MGFEFENDSVFDCFEFAAELVGWSFDPEKDERPAQSIVLLGNREDWSQTASLDIFIVAPTQERVDALYELIEAILIKRACTKAVAASLRDKLLHLSRACGGKSGRFSLCVH